MSNPLGDPGHGHSPAAWTAVIVMLFAIALGTLAFYLAIVWLVWASVALTVIGALIGIIMAKAGYGVGGSKVAAKEH